MLEKYEVCCGLFHGFDWSKWVSGNPQERLALLPNAQEYILRQEDGKLVATLGALPTVGLSRAGEGLHGPPAGAP